MNCKPGDMAVVVRIFHESQAKFLGAMVRCVEHVENDPDGCDWFYEPLSPIASHMHSLGYRLVADEALRPIRPDDLPESIDERKPADETCEL